MKSTFLDRNKKKSALAALLLFLRERKIVVLLLLLLLVASTVFLSPSSWITGLPGGTRLVASVAWVAGKMGVDVSQWGLAGNKHSFNDLMAAFASAKANSGKGPIGWGAFFGRPSNAGSGGAGGGVGQDSLGFVKGSKSDLESASASAKGGSGSGIAGAVTPEDSKADQDANAVKIDPNEAGGEREGWVKNAFAGGFMNGLLGGAGGGEGAGGLSGGAYAGKGFFNGKGGATTDSNALAKNGLAGVDPVSVPKSKIQGAGKGMLSATKAHVMEARAVKGAAGAAALGGHRAFTQLAEGRGRAALATTPNCAPPGCPGEFATTNTGAIYDGNKIEGENTGIITAPQVDGIQSPNIPDTGIAKGYEDQANQMDADAKKCQALDDQYGPTENALNKQMSDISAQFRAADCGGGGCSKSKARYCQGLGDQLKATCNQYMNVRCNHSHACPLTASSNCSNECSQSNGNRGARAVQVRSDTQGNTDGSGMSSHPQ